MRGVREQTEVFVTKLSRKTTERKQLAPKPPSAEVSTGSAGKAGEQELQEEKGNGLPGTAVQTDKTVSSPLRLQLSTVFLGLNLKPTVIQERMIWPSHSQNITVKNSSGKCDPRVSAKTP